MTKILIVTCFKPSTLIRNEFIHAVFHYQTLNCKTITRNDELQYKLELCWLYMKTLVTHQTNSWVLTPNLCHIYSESHWLFWILKVEVSKTLSTMVYSDSITSQTLTKFQLYLNAYRGFKLLCHINLLGHWFWFKFLVLVLFYFPAPWNLMFGYLAAILW